jgi:hypothetical protein
VNRRGRPRSAIRMLASFVVVVTLAAAASAQWNEKSFTVFRVFPTEPCPLAVWCLTRPAISTARPEMAARLRALGRASAGIAFFAKGWEAAPKCLAPRRRFPGEEQLIRELNRLRVLPRLTLVILSMAIDA